MIGLTIVLFDDFSPSNKSKNAWYYTRMCVFCTRWSIRKGNIVKYCILNNNYIPFIQIAGYYLNWPVGGISCTKSNFKGINSARIHKHNILKGGKRWMKGGTTCSLYKDGQWNLDIIDIFWLNNMSLCYHLMIR